METVVFRSSDSIWVLLVCMSVVSCKERISVSVGQDVLLPCIYSQVDKLPRTVTFFWRGKDDLNVYDVLDSEPDVSSQAPRFRDRISCFPDLYSKGNFSVVLRGVQQLDGGLYDCYIPSLRFRHHVNLIVAGKTVELDGGSDSGDGNGNGNGNRSGSIAVRLNLLSLLLFLLFGQIFLCDD